MLGAAKSAMGGVIIGGSPPPPLSTSVSPALIQTQVPNGTHTTAALTASAFGGTAPYSYQWSVSNPVFSIIEQSANKVKVRVSGYNRIQDTTVTCTITDNAANQVSATCTVTVIFTNQQGEVILP